jgi:hypothetical protein
MKIEAIGKSDKGLKRKFKRKLKSKQPLGF